MIGRVISTKMKNTATVLVERMAKHSLYKKTFIRSKKYLVDTPVAIKEGDLVEIVKVRPISKNKHWKVVKVVGKSLAEITAGKLKAEAEKVIAEVMPEEKEQESDVKEKEGGSKEVKSQKPKVKNSNKK